MVVLERAEKWTGGGREKGKNDEKQKRKEEGNVGKKEWHKRTKE